MLQLLPGCQSYVIVQACILALHVGKLRLCAFLNLSSNVMTTSIDQAVGSQVSGQVLKRYLLSLSSGLVCNQCFMEAGRLACRRPLKCILKPS